MSTNVKMRNLIAVAGSLTVVGLVTIGCEDKKPASVTNAASSAASAASKAMGDAAKGAGDAVKGAGDAVAGGFEKLKAEGSKWLSETVEKQWPEAKKSLESLAGKVKDIKDSATQTKAQGLVSELQAKVPQMEGLVGKLKSAGEGEFSKLFGEAKGLWDTFSSKLGELKKLIPA
jgi:hypothetical protein